MGVINEIKQKIDIVEVVGQYVQLVKSGRTFRAPCPFHSEKKPSFFVYHEQQTWHCFGACNTGGDVFSFLMKKEGVSFGEALRILAEKTSTALPSLARSEAEDQAKDRLYQINQAASQYYHNLLLNATAAEKARVFLDGRGLNSKSITDFQLGYSLPGWDGLKSFLTERGYSEQELVSAGLLIQSEGKANTYDRFRDHVMFPIMDDRGRTTGFGARVLDDSSPKYINSPQTAIFDKSGRLYGIHLAKPAIRKENLAIFVEGYFDVIVAHQYGFGNVIASMGVAITEKQISQVKKISNVFAMALDPDEAGELAMLRVGETFLSPAEESLAVRRKINPSIPTPPLNEHDLTRFPVEGKRIIDTSIINTEMKVISLSDGKDPDEIIRDDSQKWTDLVKKAIPIMTFILDVSASKYDLSKVNDRSALVEKILPLLLQLTDYSKQNYYLTRLSEITKTDYHKLELALGRARPISLAGKARPADLRQAVKYVHSSPLEEYTLRLLLHFPKLRSFRISEIDLQPEYFENSENRLIFDNYMNSVEPASGREALEPAVQDHYDFLMGQKVQEGKIEEKFKDCILRLKEKYLRNLQRKQSQLLALEAEDGDTNAVLNKLEEQGNTISTELAKIFYLRAKTQGDG